MKVKDFYEKHVVTDKPYSSFYAIIRKNYSQYIKSKNLNTKVKGGAPKAMIITDLKSFINAIQENKKLHDIYNITYKITEAPPKIEPVEIPKVSDDKSNTIKSFMELFFPNVNDSDKFIITKLLEDKIALQERVTNMYAEMEARLEGYKKTMENFINQNKKEML